MNLLRGTLAGLLFVLASTSSATTAISLHEEIDPAREVVIVNGSNSTWGTDNDGNTLRRPVTNFQIPYPEAFPVERLLGQHTIALAGTATCPRQLCLVGESIEAQLVAQPQAHYLVGLGFGSNLTHGSGQRAPLNLVAVIDRSESMRGAPLELVKRSLGEVVRHLTPKDQLAIVLYGSAAETYVPPTLITPRSRKQLLAAIDRIQCDGSASMPVGLGFGYRVADAAGADFDGTDRVMLFTDERPDVTNTAADGFVALTYRGAQLGIGLTTVGVGVPFDAQWAAMAGSVRGGNSFFMQDAADATGLFSSRLADLVGELAHDVRISITPAPGYRIADVHGLNGALLSFRGQTLEIAIPTAFSGSDVFISLAGQPGTPSTELLADVAAAYTSLQGGTMQLEPLRVTRPVMPSPGMQLARLLIDESAVLRRATAAYHVDGDQHAAFDCLHAFAAKLRNTKLGGLAAERRLVNSLEERFAFLSGRPGERELVRSRISKLWGVWRVRSVQGRTDFRANERIEFTPDSKFRFFEKAAGRHVVASVSNISANRQQILMDYSGVVYNYEVRGSELVLEERPGTLVFLQRSSLD
jgi:Ca-activated chloride channel homolog